ncbi:MAG: RNA-binding protein [Acidobacteria bacterium]|nr:RNA-binding protein [Acidobacteriota bacterium]
MKNLFVGNISFQTTESELRAAFEQFGEIDRVRIMTDRDTGRSRGFAFVEMPDEEEASKAIAGLNGKEVGGRVINVSEARPKPERIGPRSTYAGSRDSYSRPRDYTRRSS